jgi:chromosome segregation protein
MKVTDLRVTGFKSFVDPVQLKIEQGLTGIVGPNGCGKSNILESLRWVMGATSARALRGGEMDDVIFAGTDKRPARDIAEVTIVLDNSAGKAPAPFDSAPVLEVTRKIRRAAGSTFRINGKEVRARDVQLLFADASTGANSPSLVRQNQVSELINAKPENRRRILEEAAGIGGLYTRRHEAELKLRGVATNLERLDDIIGTMNDQLSALRRQAKQALRYRGIAEEIRGLEAFLFAKRLRNNHQIVEAADATLKQAERALADATIAANKAGQEAENADAGIADLRQEQAIAEAVLRRLDGQRFGLERDLKAAQDALAAAQSDIVRINGDLARETTLLDDANSNLARLKTEQDELPDDDGLDGNIEHLQLAREHCDAQRKTAEIALTNALTAQASAQGERTAQLRAYEDAKAQLLRRNAAQAHASDALNRLKNSLPATDALDQAKDEAETIANAAAQAGVAADETEKQSEDATQADLTARESARNSQNAFDRLVSEINGLDATTRQSSIGSWPRILDQIEPKQGFEKALAAALGDELEGSLDKAAPISWMHVTALPVVWPANTQVLADLMTTFPDALRLRLNSVALVEQTQFDTSSDLPAGARIVTTAGDMRRWDGLVRRAGAIANNAAKLEQRARLTHLRAGLDDAKSKAQGDASSAAKARAFADQCRALAKAARSDAPRAFASLTTAREKLMRLEAEFTRARTAIDQAEANLASMNNECEQAQALVDVTQDLLAALPIADNQDEIRELEAAVGTARNLANKAQNDLALAQSQQKTRIARRTALVTDSASWTRRLDQATARLAALERELGQAQARQVQASTAPADIEMRGRDIIAQGPAAQARKSAADDALSQLEGKIRSSRETARQAVNTLADCREARAQALARFESEAVRLEELQDEIRRNLQMSPEVCEIKARDILGPGYDSFTIQSGESRLAKLLYDRDALGGVNLRAEDEVGEQEARLAALIADKDDLVAAMGKLRAGVDQINAEGKARLIAAFEDVHKHFKVLFAALFDGGVAELQLTNSDDPLGGGLEVYACPPGKKLQSLTLMSGGEQALTASALIFAVFLANPSPICVLDEVDAPLDDSNVDRYCRLLNEMRERTQTRFIVITHHPITMARMDRLFGITMAERGVSQVVSVDLSRAEELIASA